MPVLVVTFLAVLELAQETLIEAPQQGAYDADLREAEARAPLAVLETDALLNG